MDSGLPSLGIYLEFKRFLISRFQAKISIFFKKFRIKMTFAKIIGKSYENIFKIFSKWFYLILLEPKDRLRRTN